MECEWSSLKFRLNPRLLVRYGKTVSRFSIVPKVFPLGYLNGLKHKLSNLCFKVLRVSLNGFRKFKNFRNTERVNLNGLQKFFYL